MVLDKAKKLKNANDERGAIGLKVSSILPV
jgi:hypothetical protein